jgi:serine/threonine protein kinase
VRQKFGRYELLHKVAAGGMAEIFLARQWGQAGFFRDVVIKRLFPYFAENAHVLRMFQDEARLLSELSHPNIPQVFDLGYADGHWYLAMEYVSGFSVVDICRAAAKQSRVMPVEVAIGVVSQVCSALHHAHERNDREGRPLRIVHCDVTPHNIMVTLDGVVKVFDFGVAQTAARAETDAGVVRGTYAYMAPEQIRGKPLDKRADVFAVGVVLYELLIGRRLFQGNDVQIMTEVVENDAPPPSSVIPDFPPELEQVVLKALSRDRAQRSPSAAHLLMSLEQFCLRNSLVTAPLVVSRFVRSLFPYERAQEAGMGIVPHYSAGSDVERGPESEQFEEKLLVQELRRLSQIPPTDDGYGEESVEPIELPASGRVDEDIVELDDSELHLQEEEDFGYERDPGAEKNGPLKDDFGLGEFADDAAVKPVVVLSPKPRVPDLGKSEGDFVSELERRLHEESEPPSKK